MKKVKNMNTYYNIKAEFNRKLKQLEQSMLSGNAESIKEYEKLLSEYKEFTNTYLK